MRILILYGTSEGQTRKIAAHIGERLRSRAHEVDLFDASLAPDQLDPATYDATLLASRVHTSRHHPKLVRFARRHVAALSSMPSALVSVSMSAAGHRPGDDRRVEAYLDRFYRQTGWHPDFVHAPAGARFYARQNRFARWVLGFVDGHRYDPKLDHEFTDWKALERFVDAWEAAAKASLAAPKRGIPQSG